MPSVEELFQSITSISKCVYENKSIHKNVLKKTLLNKGKVHSKNKFFMAFDYLSKLKIINVEKEMVSLNPSSIEIGVLQKENNDFFVVTPKSKKHFKVNRSVASGYKVGDLVDIIIPQADNTNQVIILGKNSKKVKSSQNEPPKVAQQDNNSENNILGRVIKVSHDNLVFIPNKKSLPSRHIPILNPKQELSAFQDKICIMNLVNLESPLLGGYITEVKGDAGNPVHEYDAIAESYGAIMSWQGKEIEDEISKIPESVNLNELNLITEQQAKTDQKGNVVDLRHIPFSTIDPATCKDMDDAIYSTFDQNGDIVCYTAVANVTKYVKLNSEIGRRYIQGGFTIYAPNKAYNILPTQLSTGICSLNPNEDRLAFVVKTTIDKSTGKVKKSKIYDAIIQSRHKYSYEQAQEIVNNFEAQGFSKATLQQKIQSNTALTDDEQIVMNYYAGQTIKVGFEQRKMIRFVANKERDIIFDDDFQTVIDIEAIPHLYYHEVIEAFMVTANEATAKYARDNSLDNIFRVHDEPNPRKMERANEFFNILGIDFDGDLSAEGTRNLIELIKDTSNEEVINKFLIKMQSRAVYSTRLFGDKKSKDEVDADWIGERISHYALQSPHYSHTTSPIRRLPDYITQYNILAHMHETQPIKANTIKNLVEIANQRQLDVDQAERDFEDISSVMYCEKHIGEHMTGRITKFRYTSPDEGYEDNIVVIVKNEEKGVNVEIPLSQILGRYAYDCELSNQKCAVYDRKGNVVLSLCKPVEFIIEKADRKAMVVVGKTNKGLVEQAEQKQTFRRQHHTKGHKNHSNNTRKEDNPPKIHKVNDKKPQPQDDYLDELEDIEIS